MRRSDSTDDVADVIAETFLVAWRRLDDVPDGDAAVLWLYGAARRVLADHRRGASRRSALASRLRDELAAADPAAGTAMPVVSRGARDLLDEIVSIPPADRRRSRPLRGRTSKMERGHRLVVISAVTALAAVLAIGLGLPSDGPITRYANAAMSIVKADDHFSVTITDPAADQRRFEGAFRAVGLDVTVKAVPVEPSRVGSLFGPIVPEGFKWHGSIGT